MKFYFSSRNIPGLEGLPLTQRVRLLQEASARMTVPEKFTLNALKLLILVPAFILVFRTFGDWTSMAGAAAIILLYPLILKPISYSMSAKYLKQEES